MVIIINECVRVDDDYGNVQDDKDGDGMLDNARQGGSNKVCGSTDEHRGTLSSSG